MIEVVSMKRILSQGKSLYNELCRTSYVTFTTNITEHANALMMIVGIGILATGLADVSIAQDDPGLGVSEGDFRIFEVTARLFELIEGNLGALIMVAAGLGAIISAAFGAYRAAVGLLVVAVGAFILRSLVDIFFDFE